MRPMKPWKRLLAFATIAYVGLFVGSHNAAVTERATFRDVRITTPALAR